MTKSYRVDGKYNFTLDFRKDSDGTYSIRALRYPDNPHSDNVRDTHVYSSGRLCVESGMEPRSLDKAIAIGKFWCTGYAHYIETGRFPNGSSRVDV